EAQSSERETLIKKGDVDYVVATYSITDKRAKAVSFAGPYFIAGQSLLVRNNNTDTTGPESLDGKKLCSVTGSTPAQTVKEKFADKVQLQEYGKYSDCITALEGGKIDAVTTDDVILAGYAAQNKGKFKLVGKPFTTERYGIGLKKSDTEGVRKVNEAIKKMEDSGAWLRSLKKYVGPSGYTIPSPPKPGADES
ncbi:MAG: transporter substrate-binding domain-containing protein, partial [Sciscionella sp.]